MDTADQRFRGDWGGVGWVKSVDRLHTEEGQPDAGEGRLGGGGKRLADTAGGGWGGGGENFEVWSPSG